MTRRLLAAALVGALLASPAVAQRQTEAEAVRQFTRTATVQTVDQVTRQVLLRDDETGDVFVLTPSAERRNLERVEPGDQLIVSYVYAVAARMAAPREGGEGAAMLVGEAAEGQRPGLVVGDAVTTVFTLDRYDRTQHIATVRGADGKTQIINVREPEMRAFASGLPSGARIEVTFSEAVAVGVAPHASR